MTTSGEVHAGQIPANATALRGKKEISISVAVAILGTALAVFGAAMILARINVPAVFLDARRFLNVSLTDGDAGKALLLMVAGIALVGIGLLTTAGGIASAIVAAFPPRR